jgi:hypothetical protein
MKIINTTNKDCLLENYPIFEVKIRDKCDDENNNNTEIYLPLQFHVANKLFLDDKKSQYFSEGNSDFLTETGAIKNWSYNDEFLRPYLVSNCYYDIMMSSKNTCTPFRYEMNYRNYFIVTQGSITVKLAPPKSARYLYPIHDYENFEFKSPINPWDPQSKYKADFDKIKCLEIVLTPGKFLFIPSYWWYSFKFSENTSVSCFKYRTYVNNIAISPQIFMYALQNQNVERKFAKNIDISLQTKKPVINENTINENTINENIVNEPIENNTINNNDNRIEKANLIMNVNDITAINANTAITDIDTNILTY